MNHSHDAAFGITKFSDLSSEEFKQILLRHKPSSPSCFKLTKGRRGKILKKREINDLPIYVDWYKHMTYVIFLLQHFIFKPQGERKILLHQ